jgi:hypothetical protein
MAGNVGSLSISYSEKSSSQSAAKVNASVSLDADYIKQYYGEDKTTFEPGQPVFLKVVPANSQYPYSLMSSNGSVSTINSNLVETIIDRIGLKNTDTAELSRTPLGSVSVSWLAGSGPNPTIVDKTLDFKQNVIGIVECSYTGYFDRLRLTTPSTMKDTEVIVLVNYVDIDPVDTSVAFESVSGVVDVNVKFTVKDIANDSVIPGAIVNITGHGVNLTKIANGLGEITATLKKGNTYNLKTTASGFTDSDVDYLNNDSVTIS